MYKLKVYRTSKTARDRLVYINIEKSIQYLFNDACMTFLGTYSNVTPKKITPFVVTCEAYVGKKRSI